MDFSGQSTIQTQNAAFYNTINQFSSLPKRASERKKKKSNMDAIVRGALARVTAKSASFDAAERGDPPKCHPDTRIAVQDSLVAWRSNRAAGPVRLISGWAGTGKTTITQTMAEYWAKRGQLAGSFFFSRSSKERSETDWIRETILHQFLQTFGVDMDAGNIDGCRTWELLLTSLNATISALPSLPQPLVIVIDGLDECLNTNHQATFLRELLRSLGQSGSSIKILISCRPERHLENVFNEFASQLGYSYRIHLGQSAEDNDDIRTFLRASFDRICQDRRNDGAMSLKDGLWPSHHEIERVVDRASGQFVFAATMIRFVDDENEDPVEMLNLVLEHQTSSFEAIDLLYILILERVEMALGKGSKSIERRQLMRNLILHVNNEPSPSLTIADFWFQKEVTVNILVKHLRAVLVRNPSSPGQDSEIVIQFRHKSFHDFFARPSAPHSFSLASMNPVSKFFLSLRAHAREAAGRPCRDDPLPTVFPYEKEARRLHQAYSQDKPTFRGCMCLPRLELARLDVRALQAFKPCRQSNCVANSDLLTLCRMIVTPHSSQSLEEQESTSSPILRFFLWLRAALSPKRHRENMG
ncbi:hypothetical protein BDN72DRAFT_966250 [Pluteus cervinus]|uniref:Uncharacterized protein n=1 Tax=Pluteus cervinus TaxID=181527 RepID=A0ACD3A1M2_9AGAR|nr:hypothetical protein BDN72DRAFT_966250 [Pluteus cervinus]